MIYEYFCYFVRNDLQEAKKQICELHRLLECKEAEMNKHRDEANRSLEEVCMMRADLEKCYDTHRKLHEESRELRKARQDMIMSTERLKNELETWKTLHDEMKNRNEKLKRELKAVQCEDYPSSVKKLQEILAQNREAMDTQVNKIACLTSQLGETKEQYSKFKQSVDEERCKADPMKGYLEKGCELEKLTRYSPTTDFPFNYSYDQLKCVLGSSWPVGVDSDMDIEY